MSKSAIFLLIVGFLATPFFVCVESAPQEIKSGPIITPNLVSLGSVDGKTFFYDNTQRTWAASKTYCESLGMQLGKIATQAQHNLLLGNYKAGFFDGWYWTSGRDARSLKQFVWDKDDSSLNDFGQSKTFGPELTCLDYRAGSGSLNGRWQDERCNYPLDFVICQTV